MEIIIVLLVGGLLTYAIVRAFEPPVNSGSVPKDPDDRATRGLVSVLQAEQRAKERFASRHVEVPSKPIPENAGTAAFIDVETTGLSVYDDEVVELAVELIAFDRATGELHGVVDSYCGLREPSIQISPGAAAVNGLSMAMVRGQRLDADKVRALCERAEFFIAHNASFDRKFTARLFPEVDTKPWFCSMRDVDWYAEGCESRSLASLLSRFCGDPIQMHRASWDAGAAVMLLSCKDSNGRPFLSQILEAHRANPAGRGAPAKWTKDPAARYRKTVFETREDRVTSGTVSITFTQTVRKERDPKPVVEDLFALLRDFMADGTIDQVEASELNDWLVRNGDLVDVWPINVLAGRMGRIVADGRIEQAELQELRELVAEITHPESLARVDLSTTATVPLTQPPPRVVFAGKIFVFTGNCLYGTRATCEQAVVARGGLFKTNVTRATDYLVVGTLRSADWLTSTHGRKIQRAVENLRAGCGTAVISEEHWARSLSQAMAAGA